MHKKLFVMFIILLLTITLAGCGGSSDTSDSSSTDSSSSSNEQTLGDMMKDPEKEAQIAKQHEMTIGETGDVEGVGVTLNQVYITEGDDYDVSELTPGYIYLVCDLSFNNQSQEAAMPFLYTYKLYANDQDCQQASITTIVDNSINLINEIAPGKSANASMAFEVPQDASTFEFQISPGSMGEDDKDVLVYKFDTSEVGKN